jgi:TolA-binding protein
VIFDDALNADQVGQLLRGDTPSVSGMQSRIWSQVHLAVSHIEQRNEAAAEAAFQKLLTDFADDKDLANGVLKVAETLRQLGESQNAKALEIYQHIVNHWPKSEHAFLAQTQMAHLYMEGSENAKFESTVNGLLTGFAGHKDLPFTIDRLATRCVERQWQNVEYGPQDKDKTTFYDGMIRKLAGYILANHRHSPYAMLARRDIATADIQTGNFAGAEVSIQQLLAEDPDNKNLPRELYFMGGSYQRMGQYERARALYQYVIEKWPDNISMMLLSLSGIATTEIALGNEPAALQTLNGLIANYREHPDLPKAVYMMAEEFAIQGLHKDKQGLNDKAKADYTKALAIWERLITELPPSEYTQHAWYFSGVCYARELKDPGKALAYYQKVVNEWPDYKYGWSAQTMIGKCYEQLVEAGAVSESAATSKIEQAYKNTIARYPDHSVAKRAYIRLARLYFKHSQWAQAADYFQQYLDKYPQARGWHNTLIQLGMTYERWGKPDVAAALYSTYLEIADPHDPRLKMMKDKIEGLKRPEELK